MNERIRKYILTFFKVIFSIIIFYIVFKKATNQESLDLFSLLSLKLLIIICLTGTIQIVINATIQQNLLLIYNLKIPFFRILKYNFISSMYLLVIPGVFAPDFYLAYQYGKEQKNYGRVIFTLILNRLIGLVVFLSLAIIGFFVLRKEILSSFSLNMNSNNANKIIIVGTFIIIVLFTLGILFRKKIIGYLKKFLAAWMDIKYKKKQVCYALFLKLAFNVVGIIGRILISVMLGISIPMWKFVSVIVIINLLVSLPISLNGIGVREAGYVGLLSIFGITGKLSLSFAICEFGITFTAFSFGFILWILSNIFKKVSHGTNLGI